MELLIQLFKLLKVLITFHHYCKTFPKARESRKESQTTGKSTNVFGICQTEMKAIKTPTHDLPRNSATSFYNSDNVASNLHYNLVMKTYHVLKVALRKMSFMKCY